MAIKDLSANAALDPRRAEENKRETKQTTRWRAYYPHMDEKTLAAYRAVVQELQQIFKTLKKNRNKSRNKSRNKTRNKSPNKTVHKSPEHAPDESPKRIRNKSPNKTRNKSPNKTRNEEGASLASKVDKTLSMLKRFKEHKAKLEKDEAELRKKGKELDEKAERIREHDAHNAAKARELEDREIKMQKIEESYEARIRSMEKEIMALKLRDCLLERSEADATATADETVYYFAGEEPYSPQVQVRSKTPALVTPPKSKRVATLKKEARNEITPRKVKSPSALKKGLRD